MVGQFPKDAPAKRLGISMSAFPIGGKRRCQESLRQLLVFLLLPRLLEGARPDLVLQELFPRMNPFLRYYGAQVIRDQHERDDRYRPFLDGRRAIASSSATLSQTDACSINCRPRKR